jgi:uncharacterized protein YndB with AHSA1/START domain
MSENNNRELTITRIFDAPRELVFKAWTDPGLVAQWWGPEGVTNPVCNLDVQPGGAIEIVMLAGEQLGELKGSEWPMKGTFQEISPPEKIVYTSSAIMDGKPIIESTNTVTFEEVDGKTKLTLTVIVTKATPEAEGPLSGMKIGWSQSIDKLAKLIAEQA